MSRVQPESTSKDDGGQDHDPADVDRQDQQSMPSEADAASGGADQQQTEQTPATPVAVKKKRLNVFSTLKSQFKKLSLRHKILCIVVPALVGLLFATGDKKPSPPPSAPPALVVNRSADSAAALEAGGGQTASTAASVNAPLAVPRPPKYSKELPGSDFVIKKDEEKNTFTPTMPGGGLVRAGGSVRAQSAEDSPAPQRIAAPVSTTPTVTSTASGNSVTTTTNGGGVARALFGGEDSFTTGGTRGATRDDVPPVVMVGPRLIAPAGMAGFEQPAVMVADDLERAAAGTPYRPVARRERDQEQQLPEIFGNLPDRDVQGSAQASKNQRSGAAAPPSSAPSTAVVQSPVSAMDQPPKEYAPFGRLVKIELLNTIDSLAPGKVPLIALVTEDVNWNGRTIIPVNTEVHGTVNTDPLLDIGGAGRLFAEPNFTLVLPRQRSSPNGREMLITGSILDRRETRIDPIGRASAWDIADLAPGLIGDTISTMDNEELKLFTASFLGSAAKSVGEILTEKEQVPAGYGSMVSQPVASVSNAITSALGSGASGALDQMVARIQASIAKRGLYVRVRGGKTLFLYIQETIDPRRAGVGLHLPETTDRDRVRAEAAEQQRLQRRRERSENATASSTGAEIAP